MEQHYPRRIFRFCPRCGSSSFEFREDFSFLCFECDFHYYINPAPAVVALITDSDGRLLFTRRAHEPAAGKLDLPGGFIDVMETAEEALAREIREELGCELTGFRYISSWPNRYLFSGLVYFTMDMVFECTISDTSSITPSDDVIAYEFIAAGDIKPEMIGLESIRNIVIDYRSILKKPAIPNGSEES